MEDGSPISPAPYTAPGIYYNPVSDRVDAIEVSTGSDVLRYGPNNMLLKPIHARLICFI